MRGRSRGTPDAASAAGDAREPRADRRWDRAAYCAIALAPALYFWPGALGRALLAPGDGVAYHFPLGVLCGRLLRDLEWPLWNPYLFGGFPLLAAIQSGAAYPGTLLFAVLPPIAAMNLLVLSSYSLAAAFTYAYTRAIGADRPGAVFAALTFSLGGFLVAHLGHTTIVHSAAFLPLLLWSLEKLRQSPRPRFAVAGAVAIALQICGGHPQVPVYVLMVAGAYVAFFAIADPPPAGRLRYVLWAGAMLALGLMLAAIQLVPTAELSGESVRARLTYEQFTSFSMPFGALPGLVAPDLLSHFGPAALYDPPLWKDWSFYETSGYVGIAALVLALGACPRIRSDRQVCFWFLVAGGALLLALGGHTPLARLTYHVPVYNLFRCPARHLLELDFALAVLSGLALSRPAGASCRTSTMVAALSVASCIAIVTIAVVWRLSARVLPAPAIALPLAIGLPAALLSAWVARSPAPGRRALLLAVQVVDLFLFAPNEVWRTLPSAAEVLRPPRYSSFLRSAGADLGDRRVALVAPEVQTPAALATGAFDLPAYWRIPSIQGYEQLMLSRYARFAGDMGSAGEVWIPRVLRSPGFLDLLSVKYAVLWTGTVAEPVVRSGIAFDARQMEFAPTAEEPVRLELPSPRRATALALVSALGDSIGVVDGTPVARVVVEGSRGEVIEAPVLAGVHTAEWAWDRPQVRDQVRHRRAAIAEGLLSDGFPGHLYLGLVEFGRPIDVKALRLESLRTAITIRRLSLYDAEDGRSHPLTPLHRMWHAAEDTSRWRVAWSDDQASILENLRVLPRAWMASEAAALDAESALAVITSGKLPDGRDFDPRATALVDASAGEGARAVQGGGSVEIVARSPHAIELAARSPGPGFLVTSEIDYPGWKAYVDGVETKIVRTDSVLRGLSLPGGEHRVRFVFRPSSVKLGAAVSLAAVLVAAGLLWSDAGSGACGGIFRRGAHARSRAAAGDHRRVRV